MSLSISWSEPELCTYDGDLSKYWFVYFDITNDITGETKRKQFRGGINYYSTKEDRLEQGNALKAYWKKKLKSGSYNPFQSSAIHNPVSIPETVGEALERILALKKAALKPKSYRGYRDIYNGFLKWLQLHGYQKLRLYQFGPKFAQTYCDYLLLEKKYGGKTHNIHHGILHAFFSEMMKPGRQWIEVNPFKGITMLPEDLGSNMPYDEQEARDFIEHLRKHDIRMYFAVNFVFHGFIRKTELTTIRVREINWENRTIRINSESAKNRIQDSITIPDALLQVLIEMDLQRAPKMHFIFGKKMETCPDQMTRPDDISDRYLIHKLALGYKAGDEKAFYSWKPTGVIAYWNLLKDPYCHHEAMPAWRFEDYADLPEVAGGESECSIPDGFGLYWIVIFWVIEPRRPLSTHLQASEW